MQYYVKNGNKFVTEYEIDFQYETKLPVGNYLVKYDASRDRYYFEMMESFTCNHKRYGNNVKHTNRIINTYMSRENSTGVLLVGEKGSGKTLLSKTVSIEGYKLDIPTLIINEPYCGDTFNKFIQDIEQPTIIIFDEFEKVYDSDDQNKVLTLLDGTFPSKKLFIISSNSKYSINEYMKNRPGRMFYMLEFTGLDDEFIVEYCEDNLINKKYINDICKIKGAFHSFNFDMLKSMVEEMNRYDESPKEVLSYLNITLDTNLDRVYNVRLFIDGVEVDKKFLEETKMRCRPLYDRIDFSYRDDWNKSEEDEYNDYIYVSFRTSDIASMTDKSEFIYKKDNYQLILTPEKVSTFNPWDVF